MSPSPLIRTATQIPHPRWLVRGAAVAATVVALILSAPLIWVAVSAGLGLVALAGLALTGTLLFQALPLLGQTLENRLLKLRKAQARTNPIEQLQMEVLRRAERLTAFRKALATVGGQIESITQMLDERRHKDPNHVLERQQRALQRLRQFQQVNLNRLAEAQSALEEFRCTVERKNSEWTIALAIDDTAQLLDPNAAEHLMQDLLTDTALRSVDAPTSELLSEQGYERLDLLTVSEPATSRRTS